MCNISSNLWFLQWESWDLGMRNHQSIGLTMENMRFEHEKCSNTIGFALEIMRYCNYEKSSQSIGLAMENMRFEYEKCSNTIGFALEIMRYCMRNHLNPLDLQGRTWDSSMRNEAIPLDLHWNPWDFVWEIIPIHWTCNGEHEVWVWETLDYGTCILRFITTWQWEDPEYIRRQRSKRCSYKQRSHLPSR